MKKHKMKFVLFIILLFLFLEGDNVFANNNEKPVLKILENGMTIVVKENHRWPVVCVKLFVNTGSIYEGEYLGSGISHILEHLVHESNTPTRTRKESNLLVESMGNTSNAYTSWDRTVYFLTVPKKYLKDSMELIADWCTNADFPEEDFKEEFGVVQRELEKNLDSPTRQLFTISAENLFLRHPARLPIIGKKELLTKLTRDDIIKYYRRTYVPSNMTLAVAGDVNADDVIKMAEELFKAPPGQPIDNVLPIEPPPTSPRYRRIGMPVKSAYLSINLRTVPIWDDDVYSLDVLAFVLESGQSSRLVKVLQQDNQLVTSVDVASYTPSFDAGDFMIIVNCPYENLDKVKKLIRQEIEKLAVEPVTNEELSRAKKLKESERLASISTVEGVADDIGWWTISTGSPEGGEHYLKRILDVDAEQIMKAAKKYLNYQRVAISEVVPQDELEKNFSQSRSAQPDKDIKVTLDNGLTVVSRLRKDSGLVSLRAYFRGGALTEVESTNGWVRFLSNMLIRGTTSRSFEQITKEIEEKGGLIGTTSGFDAFSVDVIIPPGAVEAGIDILCDVLVDSTFPEDEIEKLRILTLSAIKRRTDDPRLEAELRFKDLFFVNSPYRFDPLGREESIKTIKRDDIVKLYQELVVSGNLVISVAGDVEQDMVVKMLENKLVKMNTGKRIAPPKLSGKDKRPDEVNIPTEKGGAYVYVGYPGIDILNKADYYPILLADVILSGYGYPGGWLHTELRGKQLVYVVHAYNEARLLPGGFIIWAATPAGKAEKVKQIILERMKDITEGKFSDVELSRARKSISNAFLLRMQDNPSWSMRLGVDEILGLGYQNYTDFVSSVNNVSRERVIDVCKRYFKNPTVVVVKPENKEES